MFCWSLELKIPLLSVCILHVMKSFCHFGPVWYLYIRDTGCPHWSSMLSIVMVCFPGRFQQDSSESRTGSSLSLARVRPSTITNGTSKHSSSATSTSTSTSSHGKTQRSASTYHRQRRHSDFCEYQQIHRREHIYRNGRRDVSMVPLSDWSSVTVTQCPALLYLLLLEHSLIVHMTESAKMNLWLGNMLYVEKDTNKNSFY